MRTQGSKAKTLLVIGHRWPEPEATAAGSRMMGLLEGFLKEGYNITFASASVPGLYGIPLEPLGIQTVRIALNDAAFNEYLKSNPFEMVLFDRFMTEEQFGWRVRECLPESTLVLDTEDLHSLRHSREKAIGQGRAWNVESWMMHPHFYREIASIVRCDFSLLVSAAECDLLKSHLPMLEGKLYYLPFQMKPATEDDPVEFQQRSGFVFVGTGMHRPNLDAIDQLKNQLWPVLSRRLPRVILRIYGAYLPRHILGFHNPHDRFEVCGWAPSLKQVFCSARLQLAPLRFGAGVKGKILSALQYGLPTLGSPISMEGIHTGETPVDFIADSTEEYVQKAVRLYENEAVWQAALQTLYSGAAPHYEDSFPKLLEALENREDHLRNLSPEVLVIQRLLRDQAFDRLRYLSKWIEAKADKEF